MEKHYHNQTEFDLLYSGSETNMLNIDHHEENQMNMVFYSQNQPMNDLLNNGNQTEHRTDILNFDNTHQNEFQENTTFCGINRPYNNNPAEYNISNYNKYDNLMMNSESTRYEQFTTNIFCDLDALISCDTLYSHN
ncbi:hypothetical protein C2G38_1481633 [Gigaspora rosea]|uniref:Uncharacterized protein n=1 Tax=Gigaspora rosea TaxID=44941 RepID=A0A397V7B0_9GLOM|nr:hypothetical protein C2G38_1481633 [Gigaspora rosea]